MNTNKTATLGGFIRFLRRAPILLFLVAVGGLSPGPAGAFDVLLGTEKEGSFSHFAGRAICRMINRQAGDLDCRAVPASGDVHNLTNLQGGSLDMALVDSRMLHDAVNKKGYFEFLDIRYDGLHAVAPLYQLPITLVARKDARIGSLADLKGKRINAGAPRSAAHLAVDTILDAKGWTEADFGLVDELSASQSQDSMAFCHGSIQAMVHIGVHPDPSLKQLFRLCGAVLVDMDDDDIRKLIRDHGAFSRIEIAPSTYPSQPRPVATFGTSVVLVAGGSLDVQTAYRIVEALDRSRQSLRGAHPALTSFSVDSARQMGVKIHLHPGTVRYLEGKGK